jgi:hypothetical protein
MIFSVTYFLELRDATSIYYISHIGPKKWEIDILYIIEHLRIYLVKKCKLVLQNIPLSKQSQIENEDVP